MADRFVNSAKLNSLEALRRFFLDYVCHADARRETLWVAHVDEASHCLHVSCHVGHDTTVHLPLRSIIADAIKHTSAGIFLAHNHPSGDARPSKSDLQLTRKLALVGEAIDCSVLDHFIFAGAEFTSFKRDGLL